MIRETFKSLFTKGSFTQDVAIVGGGKVAVAIIGFLFIPILSRIFPPEAYGAFSFYSSTIAILIPAISLSFPAAMVIAQNEKWFYNLVFISSLLVISFSLLSVIIIFFFGSNIQGYLHLDFNYLYFLFIPSGIFLNGILQIFSNWNIRRKYFKYGATVAVGHNLFIRIFNIVYGLLIASSGFGLILGNQIGRFLAIISHTLKTLLVEKYQFIHSISFENIKLTWKEFKTYPRFILPTEIILAFRNFIIIYFIGIGFGNNVLGNFSMTISLLSIPIQILGNSLSPVFQKKASDLHIKGNNEISHLVNSILTKLLILGFIPFLILTLFGKEILVFMLGSNWEAAGQFTSYLSLNYFTYVLFFPVFSIYQIYKKEKLLFRVNLLSIILIIVALLVGILIDDSNKMIILFSAASIIGYFIQAIVIFQTANIKYVRLILNIVFAITIIVIALFFKLHFIY